uniref:Ig-like domain-containing protein n=1 Tax=Ditylenchus dipsaci TaxID=166011 RepID=A0A915ET64_9BILA
MIIHELEQADARKPVVTLSPSEPIQEAPSTSEQTIQCEATGVPKPKIIWFWNNFPVEDGKDGFRVYDISPIDAQDKTQSKLIAQSTTRTGLAKCQAVNDQGVDEGTVPVKVLGPGSAPENIQTKTVQNGFNVDWKPPTIPNGDITNTLKLSPKILWISRKRRINDKENT